MEMLCCMIGEENGAMIYQNREESLSVKLTKNNNCFAHIHRQVEIFYVLDGSIEITISGQKKILEKGMVSIAFPNVIHETYTPAGSSAVMMIFSHDILPDFYHEFNLMEPCDPFIDTMEEADRFAFLVQGLLDSMQKSADGRIPKGYLYTITSLILSQLPLMKQQKVSADICQAISGYLNRHFMEDISLPQLAAALGYSKYHISHIFKEKFGCSYSDYLKRLRTEHAMGLLAHSELTVTDICFASGFNSLRSFYRAFHELYGVAPRSVK